MPLPARMLVAIDRPMMTSIGTRGDTARTALTPGYRNAIDGLRGFDDVSRALGKQRDDVMRGVARAAAYPQPAYTSPVAAGSAIGAAVAAFVDSEGGRAAIARAVAAAGTFLRGAFGEGGAVQLPLPFE